MIITAYENNVTRGETKRRETRIATLRLYASNNQSSCRHPFLPRLMTYCICGEGYEYIQHNVLCIFCRNKSMSCWVMAPNVFSVSLGLLGPKFESVRKKILKKLWIYHIHEAQDCILWNHSEHNLWPREPLYWIWRNLLSWEMTYVRVEPTDGRQCPCCQGHKDSGV